jgi:hypothetical protein
MSDETKTDKPDGEREGPGGIFWIASAAVGFMVAMLAITIAGFVPSLGEILFAAPLGMLVGAAAYAARERHRGWIVLAIMVTAIVAAWAILLAVENYESHRGPTPLF